MEAVTPLAAPDSPAADLRWHSAPPVSKTQKNHREAPIADTYTMILRPVLDRLAESVTA